jgi:hypothetical protein
VVARPTGLGQGSAFRSRRKSRSPVARGRAPGGQTQACPSAVVPSTAVVGQLRPVCLADRQQCAGPERRQLTGPWFNSSDREGAASHGLGGDGEAPPNARPLRSSSSYSVEARTVTSPLMSRPLARCPRPDSQAVAPCSPAFLCEPSLLYRPRNGAHGGVCRCRAGGRRVAGRGGPRGRRFGSVSQAVVQRGAAQLRLSVPTAQWRPVRHRGAGRRRQALSRSCALAVPRTRTSHPRPRQGVHPSEAGTRDGARVSGPSVGARGSSKQTSKKLVRGACLMEV